MDDNIVNDNIKDVAKEDTEQLVAAEPKPDNTHINKDYKLKEGRVATKKYKVLPNAILDNLDLLKNITKFLDKNAGGDVSTLDPDKIPIAERRTMTEDELDQLYDEYEELTEMSDLLDEFLEILDKFNNNEDFKTTRLLTKMTRLKRIAARYI